LSTVVILGQSAILYKFRIGSINFLVSFVSSLLLCLQKIAKKLLQALLQPLKVAQVSVRLAPRSRPTLAMNLHISLSKQRTGIFQYYFLCHILWYLCCFIFVSVDEEEVIEISNNKMEGEHNDELAITPPHSSCSCRIGPPSTPSPVKSLFVLFYLAFFYFILSKCYIFSGKKCITATANQDEEMTVIPRYALEFFFVFAKN